MYFQIYNACSVLYALSEKDKMKNGQMVSLNRFSDWRFILCSCRNWVVQHALVATIS